MKNILIVDDNIIFAKLIKTTLEKKGNLSIQVCHDGSEAKFDILESDYHLILMDIQMALEDGVTVTKYVREHETHHNYICALTANTSLICENDRRLFDDVIDKSKMNTFLDDFEEILASIH